MDASDYHLIQRSRAGDLAACDALMARYQGLVFTVAHAAPNRCRSRQLRGTAAVQPPDAGLHHAAAQLRIKRPATAQGAVGAERECPGSRSVPVTITKFDRIPVPALFLVSGQPPGRGG